MINPHRALPFVVVSMLAGCGSPISESESVAVNSSALELASNDRGFAESFHTSGTIDRTNPFFTPNGGNGRTCETCHLSDQGWTITPSAVADLFNSTQGLARTLGPSVLRHCAAWLLDRRTFTTGKALALT